MMVLAIDPGSKESAYVCFNSFNEHILDADLVPNDVMLSMCHDHTAGQFLAIESIEGFGMTAGQELFDTCWWSGRFCQAFLKWPKSGQNMPKFQRIGRKAIKTHLCGCTTAKDKDIREALIYRFGEPGIKSKPGKLYGISGHCWSALAVAVVFSDSLKITTKTK